MLNEDDVNKTKMRKIVFCSFIFIVNKERLTSAKIMLANNTSSRIIISKFTKFECGHYLKTERGVLLSHA